MKKIALLLVIVIFLSTMLTSCSMLPDYTARKIYNFFDRGRNYSEELYYSFSENGYIVSGRPKLSGDVRIRSTFKNMPVTAIAEYAFEKNKNIKSITIPNSVTSIGYGAFYGCTSLTSITIPDNVTHLGGGAFAYCYSLTNVTIPEGVLVLPQGLFFECDLLTAITIPSSVLSIDEKVFKDCRNLARIYYRGTEEQWNMINKGVMWDYNTGNYTVIFNYTGE